MGVQGWHRAGTWWATGHPYSYLCVTITCAWWAHLLVLNVVPGAPGWGPQHSSGAGVWVPTDVRPSVMLGS